MPQPPKRPRKPTPAAVKTAPSKGELHPRNRHQGRYDFPALIKASPELGDFVITNPYGKPSIDFANPAAVKVFNRALLAQYYGIRHWDIPDGYLCPPIPGRADYLHNLADLLASDNDGQIPHGEKVRALDIGVGADAVWIDEVGGVFNPNSGDQVFFDVDDPFLGRGTNGGVNVTLRPVARLQSELTLDLSRFVDTRQGDVEVFNVKIVRAFTTYQFTDRLLLRNIAEYNTFSTRLGANLLLTYRINAGTVFYAGYDDHYQQGDHIDEEQYPTPDLRRTNRASFTKLQYLFRH